MYKNPEWSYSAVLYEMNVRQLTPQGDLRSAAERLPFLRSIGIDAVWLMPIYPIGEEGRKGSLGSYYSIRDYMAVNPEFGDEADLRHFITVAHSLGMRVLLDWVANHTARDARWVTQRPLDWYERDTGGVPQLRKPRRVARPDRGHALLGGAVQRRWLPLRHGYAGAH